MGFQAEVRKNPDWTSRDAKRHGIENSLRSAKIAHTRAVQALEAAQIEEVRTAGDVAAMEQLLAEFEAEE